MASFSHAPEKRLYLSCAMVVFWRKFTASSKAHIEQLTLPKSRTSVSCRSLTLNSADDFESMV